MDNTRVSIVAPNGQETDITPAIRSKNLEIDIKEAISESKEKKTELRKLRRQYKDIFENDREYSTLSAELKDLKAKLKARQIALRDDGSTQALEETIAEIADEVKDQQLTLSGYLKEWADQGNNHIIDSEGNNLEIVVTAKVRKAK